MPPTSRERFNAPRPEAAIRFSLRSPRFPEGFAGGLPAPRLVAQWSIG